MAVPHINQVIIGGYFFEELKMGNITLTCSTSNNVYVGYLKDDTWLATNVISDAAKCEIYPNPFSKQGRIITEDDIISIKIYNASAVFIEEYNETNGPIVLGKNWQKGVYFVHVFYENGQHAVVKAVKI